MRSRIFILIIAAATLLSGTALAQKRGAHKAAARKKIDPVLPVIERAEKAMAEGKPDEARKAYEEAFKLDKFHSHDAVNIGLATFLLEDRFKQGDRYDLTKEQLTQRFKEVPY